MRNPRVFYGSSSDTSRSSHLPRARSSDHESEDETEIEEPKRFKRINRRMESKEPNSVTPKRARVNMKSKDREVDVNGRRPLQRMCVRGNVEAVRDLLNRGVDVNARDYAGTAALHSAAIQGDAEIVKMLIDAGALIDIRSAPDELDTPLMDAVANGNVDVVKCLLDAGADPRIPNVEGLYALDFVNQNDPCAEEITSMLRKALHEVRHKPMEDNSVTSLSSASDGVARSARRDDSIWLDVTTKSGRAEVVRRAAQGDLAYIGTAIEYGWQPTTESLCVAARSGHEDVVGLLLAFGVSPNEEFNGRTALAHALGRGHLATIRLLINSGTDLKWRSKDGRQYTDYAEEFDEERVILEEAQAKHADQTKDATPQISGDEQMKDEEAVENVKNSNSPAPSNDVDVNRIDENDEGNGKRESLPDSQSWTTFENKDDKTSQSPTSHLEIPSPGANKSLARLPGVPEDHTKNSPDARRDDSTESEKLDKKWNDSGKIESVHVIGKLVELEALAARRERERRAREEQMLLNLENEERRRSVVRDAETAAVVAEPQDPEKHDLQLGYVPASRVAGWPWALQQLAYSGKPQHAYPLLVHHISGIRHVLDIQMSLVLGKPKLHLQHPRLTKIALSPKEKHMISALALPWLCPPTASNEEKMRNRENFEKLTINWIRVDEMDLPSDLPCVKVSLERKCTPIDQDKYAYDLPIRIAAKLKLIHQQQQWTI